MYNGHTLDYRETREALEQLELALGEEIVLAVNPRSAIRLAREARPDALILCFTPRGEDVRWVSSSFEIDGEHVNVPSIAIASRGGSLVYEGVTETIVSESGEERVIFEYDVAERIVYSNIYLNVEMSPVLEHWIVKVAEHIGASAGSIDREAMIRERTERQIAEWSENVYSSRIAETRVLIDSAMITVASHRDAIAREFRSLRNNQHLLDGLLASADTSIHAREQFELLEEHPRVDSVQFNNGAFIVTTHEDLRMTRTDTGESRWLGAFKMNIPIAGDGINLTNLNTRRGGRNHPHVSGDGTPCFGGHTDSMYELLGRGEIYVVVDLLIQYLESVNMRDSWGSYAALWFEIEDERPLESADQAEEVAA